MSADDIPEPVQRLLRDHLTSFEHLEVMLLLRGSPDQDWDVEGVTQQARVPAELIGPAVEGLEASGLVKRSSTGATPVFRYGPAHAELAQALDALAEAYEERRATIMSIMSVNAIERIRSKTMRAFADSFVLGRKPRNG